MYNILIDRRNKNSTPLHVVLTRERTRCMKRYFSSLEDHANVNVEFDLFSTKLEILMTMIPYVRDTL